MQKSLLSLQDGGWHSDNVDNWHALRVRARYAVDGAELSDSERGNDASQTASSSIASMLVQCSAV